MEGTIGEIRMFAADFAPKNWLMCAGQTIAINQNQALFAIIGTTYGGDGVSTFRLPDLRSRNAVGTGNGPGLPPVALGQMAGTEAVTLTQGQLPAHNHLIAQGTVNIGTAAGLSDPTGAYPALTSSDIYAESSAGVTMANGGVTGQTTAAGGNQPLPIVQPYLGMNYIICQYGIFPSRS